jgi:hypothetical protein
LNYTYQSPWGDRYRSDEDIKKNPKNDAEAALRDSLMADEAKQILSRYSHSPSYQKELLIEMAKQTGYVRSTDTKLMEDNTNKIKDRNYLI